MCLFASVAVCYPWQVSCFFQTLVLLCVAVVMALLLFCGCHLQHPVMRFGCVTGAVDIHNHAPWL